MGYSLFIYKLQLPNRPKQSKPLILRHENSHPQDFTKPTLSCTFFENSRQENIQITNLGLAAILENITFQGRRKEQDISSRI